MISRSPKPSRGLRIPRPSQLSSRHPLYLLGAVHPTRVLPPAGPGRRLRRGVPVDQRAPRLSLGRFRYLVSVFISPDNFLLNLFFSFSASSEPALLASFRSTRHQAQRRARRHGSAREEERKGRPH